VGGAPEGKSARWEECDGSNRTERAASIHSESMNAWDRGGKTNGGDGSCYSWRPFLKADEEPWRQKVYCMSFRFR
jgi:hypothetical protein